MTFDTDVITKDWKTTAMGSAVLAVALLSSVKFDASGHIAMTTRDWFVAVIGVLGQVIGATQKDAGK
ncbi:MAG: hypothetical protein M3O02_11205 [Acidobacteriota bacterium]|nr:hypothetical protein [Acidobacteriota bacterium]